MFKKLAYIYKKHRGQIRRLKRLVFMSPAEARFVAVMGGAVYTLPFLKSKRTGFPFSIVLTLGRTLRTEKFKREVRFGKYFVDFANDVDRIIEIDGATYHMDVVADFERDQYIRGWHDDVMILRIKAAQLYREPNLVQADVIKFIYG